MNNNMYRIVVSIFACFAITLFLCNCSGSKYQKKQQQYFFPKYIGNLYFGLTLNQLKRIRGTEKISIPDAGILPRAREECNTDSMVLITYQFDKASKLYEIIIDFEEEFDAGQYAVSLYGEPNRGREWLISINKRLKIKIWVFRNRLCIADNKYFRN